MVAALVVVLWEIVARLQAAGRLNRAISFRRRRMADAVGVAAGGAEFPAVGDFNKPEKLEDRLVLLEYWKAVAAQRETEARRAKKGEVGQSQLGPPRRVAGRLEHRLHSRRRLVGRVMPGVFGGRRPRQRTCGRLCATVSELSGWPASPYRSAGAGHLDDRLSQSMDRQNTAAPVENSTSTSTEGLVQQ
jgi:hypothetical protein